MGDKGQVPQIKAKITTFQVLWNLAGCAFVGAAPLWAVALPRYLHRQYGFAEHAIARGGLLVGVAYCVMSFVFAFQEHQRRLRPR